MGRDRVCGKLYIAEASIIAYMLINTVDVVNRFPLMTTRACIVFVGTIDKLLNSRTTSQAHVATESNYLFINAAVDGLEVVGASSLRFLMSIRIRAHVYTSTALSKSTHMHTWIELAHAVIAQ